MQEKNLKKFVNLAFKQFRSFSFIALLASALLVFIFENKRDTYIFLIILVINFFLLLGQEMKAFLVLRKFASLIERRVYVSRFGLLEYLPIKELKVGDIVHFKEGSIVPFSAEVFEATNAKFKIINEPTPTIEQTIKVGDELKPNTIILSGRVLAIIKKSISPLDFSSKKSGLDSLKKTDIFNLFIKNLLKNVIKFCTLILLLAMPFLIFFWQKFSPIQFIVFGAILLISVLPEMLSMATSLIFTKEAIKLSEKKIFLSRLSTIGSLAEINFLLIDLNSTLTQNNLKIQGVYDLDNLWEYANSVAEGEYERTLQDSAFDEAILHSSSRVTTGITKITNFYLSSDGKISFFSLADGSLVARGNIEDILNFYKFKKDYSILESVKSYEAKGMRVLAYAHSLANEWQFAGFIAFFDSLKKEAPLFLKTAHLRGVQIKIFTSDSEEVAEKLAEELGLIKTLSSIVSLKEKRVNDLNNQEIISASVFSDCSMSDRVDLLKRYESIGRTGYLGTDTKETEALLSASVGITTFQAQDVLQNSADLILSKEDLGQILKAITKSRRAVHLLLNYLLYTLSANLGAFISLILASFLLPKLPMTTSQILLTHFIVAWPMILFLNDQVDDIFLDKRPVLSPKNILLRLIAFGGMSALFDVLFFLLYVPRLAEAQLATSWFLFSVLADIILLLSIRSPRFIFNAPKIHFSFLVAILLVVVLPFIFIYVKIIGVYFDFYTLYQEQLILIGGLLLLYLLANEGLKFFLRLIGLHSHQHKLNYFKKND